MIYTVQNGSLANQRIIKIKAPGTSTYKGFAFVMSDGTMKLWRSHREEMDRPYVNTARVLITTLANDSDVRSVMTNDSFTYSHSADMYISFKMQCIRCNYSGSLLSTGWCADHSDCISDLRASIQNDERMATYESRRARRNTFTAATPSQPPVMVNGWAVDDRSPAPGAIIDASTLTIAPLPRSVIPPPLLSENGTGLVR
jgi:hypothetical protein